MEEGKWRNIGAASSSSSSSSSSTLSWKTKEGWIGQEEGGRGRKEEERGGMQPIRRERKEMAILTHRFYLSLFVVNGSVKRLAWIFQLCKQHQLIYHQRRLGFVNNSLQEMAESIAVDIFWLGFLGICHRASSRNHPLCARRIRMKIMTQQNTGWNNDTCEGQHLKISPSYFTFFFSPPPPHSPHPVCPLARLSIDPYHLQSIVYINRFLSFSLPSLPSLPRPPTPSFPPVSIQCLTWQSIPALPYRLLILIDSIGNFSLGFFFCSSRIDWLIFIEFPYKSNVLIVNRFLMQISGTALSFFFFIFLSGPISSESIIDYNRLSVTIDLKERRGERVKETQWNQMKSNEIQWNWWMKCLGIDHRLSASIEWIFPMQCHRWPDVTSATHTQVWIDGIQPLQTIKMASIDQDLGRNPTAAINGAQWRIGRISLVQPAHPLTGR